MTPVTRRTSLAGLCGAAFATAASAAARAQAPDSVASDPVAPIAALNDALLAAMKAGRATPFAQRVAALEPAIRRAFALADILKASVGPRFAKLTPAEQNELSAAFTDFTLASYAANFDSFAGERFVVAPQVRASGADQVVQTRIVPAKGEPVRLDYVMRRDGSGWHAVDVLLDGSISRVAVQRSDFRSLLAGGSAAPLIASLREKTARLANGTKS